MYPENLEGTRVIVGSMNMGYDIFDTARNRTHNLFRPKCVPIPLGYSDLTFSMSVAHNQISWWLKFCPENSWHAEAPEIRTLYHSD